MRSSNKLIYYSIAILICSPLNIRIRPIRRWFPILCAHPPTVATFNRMVRCDTIFLTAPHEVLHAEAIPFATDIRIPVMFRAKLKFNPDVRNRTIVVIIAKQTIFIDTRNIFIS